MTYPLEAAAFVVCVVFAWWAAWMMLRSALAASATTAAVALAPVYSLFLRTAPPAWSPGPLVAAALAAAFAAWLWFHLHNRGTSRLAVLVVGFLCAAAAAAEEQALLVAAAFMTYLAWNSSGRRRILLPLACVGMALAAYIAMYPGVLVDPDAGIWDIGPAVIIRRIGSLIHRAAVGSPISASHIVTDATFWWPVLPALAWGAWASRREKWFAVVGPAGFFLALGVLQRLEGHRLGLESYTGTPDLGLFFLGTVCFASAATRRAHERRRIEAEAPDAAPPATSDIWERRLFIVGLCASIAILAAIARPMLAGRVYTIDDLGNYHIPARAFYAKCLAQGYKFDWFPNVFCGYYLQGDGQVGMYHPWHWLLYRYLSLTAAFNIELIFSYPMMLVGMYLFLRREGLARDGAIYGALTLAFSGFTLLHFMHMQGICIIAHLPWILIAISVSLTSVSRRKAAAANLAVALLVASQILIGYLQYTWMTSLVAALYGLYLYNRWKSVWRIIPLAGAVLCAAFIGAVQILPTYGEIHAVGRITNSAYGPLTLSLPPVNLVQLVGPLLFSNRVVSDDAYPHTQEYGLYDGAATIAMFVLLAAGAIRLRHKAGLAAGGMILVVVGFLLALGGYGKVYVPLSKIPFIGWFRAPARYILVAHVGLALCAAVCFQAVREKKGRSAVRMSRVLGALMALLAASVIAVILTGWPFGGGAPRWAILAAHANASQPDRFAGPVLIALTLALILLALKGMKAALAALIILTACDLGFYGLSFATRDEPRRVEAVAEYQSHMLPRQQGFYRIEKVRTDEMTPAMTGSDSPDAYAWLPFASSRDIKPTLAGYYQVTGYGGLPPAKALDYKDKEVLRLACAKWVVLAMARSDVPDVEMTVLEVPDPMRRARLVANAVNSSRPAKMLRRINITETAIVDRDLGLEPGTPGTAAITRDLPGDIAVAVDTPSRQLLVVSESYHRGWKSSIDGVDTPALRTYGDFLGVVVDKGHHEVRLSFEPAELQWGKRISILGAVLTGLVFAGAWLWTDAEVRGGKLRRR